ncbi:MAG: hypothetical protein JNK05_22275 [Myxococcales bacterium]|nr:hypothetical protein [Myxococcales bacterium]
MGDTVAAMTAHPRWLHALIEANQAREGYDDAAAAALADEAAAMLGSLDFVIVDDGARGDGVALAVIEPNGRACCLEFAPAPGRAGSLLRSLADAARARGSDRLWSAGPPRWYLRSGVDADEADAWAALGARVTSRHVDLLVDASSCRPVAGEPSVERVDAAAIEGVARWVGQEFSNDWATEVRAAGAVGGVFVCRYGSDLAAFAAHSGHAVARGTFGPLGTARAARGRGLGGRIAAAAIADLWERGFETALVPWVEPSIVSLYGRVARVLDRRDRVLFTLNLAAPTK